MMFTKLKHIFVVLVVMTMPSLSATTVVWGKMISDYVEDMDSGPLWQVRGGWLDVRPIIMVTVDLDLCASPHIAGLSTIWSRQMAPGEIVDAETMFSDGTEYFYCATQGVEGDVKSDYSILIEGYGLPIYLGFATPNSSGSMVYGWVGINVVNNHDVRTAGSAWDLDGGPMIVGGGAIPEPTAAVLLVLGAAVLGLRRKQNSWERTL